MRRSPAVEARNHLDALRATPNGAKVMMASLTTMHQELVRLTLESESLDRKIAREARRKAVDLAEYLDVVYQQFDVHKGEWK